MAGCWVNDVHSQLNPTHVSGVVLPRDLDELRRSIADANDRRQSVSICGGRHAGGGQQFKTDRLVIDSSNLNRVLSFDAKAGIIEVEAGIRWPGVFADLQARKTVWGIHQKQGGAEELSLGGAVGSNIHSRCLRSKPFVQDVQAMTVVMPDGSVVNCDRENDGELFRRIIGGYGMFGVVYSLKLRLERRQKLVRRVQWMSADQAMSHFHERRDAGALHGDFQFSIDPTSPDFCVQGLCTTYEPCDQNLPTRPGLTKDAPRQFTALAEMAHRDKSIAMQRYREALLSTDGKVVDWSDQWLRGNYAPGYHKVIDPSRGGAGSEVLSELYVPRESLEDFLKQSARIIRANDTELIYGVVRLVECDDETHLAWANRPYACVIFNLHTQLMPQQIEKVAVTFRQLLDAAIALDGSYYLTYHRFARLDQVTRCYPQFGDFLSTKERFDPRGIIASDWHAFYRRQLLGV
jgi:FAD/FMN-containing dehydrogenase